jgi:hypothetical protein
VTEGHDDEAGEDSPVEDGGASAGGREPTPRAGAHDESEDVTEGSGEADDSDDSVDVDHTGDDRLLDPAVAELERGPLFDDDAPAPRPAPPRRRGTRGNGSVLAAAMLGLRDLLEGPPKESIVIQAEAPGEPPDVDKLGLKAELEDGRRAVAPPLDDLKGKAADSRRIARRRRRAKIVRTDQPERSPDADRPAGGPS